jgi:hypothetical protein
MSSKKITQLPEATFVDGTEIVPFVQAGATKKATLNTITSNLLQGPQGPAGNSFNWQGDWSSASAYVLRDVVYYNGNSFICIQNHSNVVPANNSYWNLIAQKGADGTNGTNGTDGADGLDGESFVWQGTWSAINTYVENDVVEFGGSAFIAVDLALPGDNPTGSIVWDLFVSRSLAATIEVGTVTTGAPGASASVTNVGTLTDAVFDFVIPEGIQGIQGPQGVPGFGLPSGGIDGQYIVKNGALDYDARWQALSVTNNDVSPTAAIVYSKLNLASGIVNNDISATANIAWVKIDKAGSSLADLTTRSASDLATGTLSDLRLSSNVPLKNAQNDYTAQNTFTNVALTYSGTMSWNVATGQVASVVLTGSPTMTATGQKNGGFYSLLIIQDGTGSKTISWDSNVFKFIGGSAPTLSTSPNARDILVFRSDGTLLMEVGRSLGVA